MKFSQLNEYADGKILAGVVDATGHIVINNPDRHNAVSKDMYEAAAEQAEAMASDDNVRLLMLRGQGEKPLPQVRIFQNLKKNAIARNRSPPIRQLPPDFIPVSLIFQSQLSPIFRAIVSAVVWRWRWPVICVFAKINPDLRYPLPS